MYKKKLEDYIIEGIYSAIFELSNSKLVSHGKISALSKDEYCKHNYFNHVSEDSLVFSDFNGSYNLYVYKLPENQIGIFIVKGSNNDDETKSFLFDYYANFIVTTENTYVEDAKIVLDGAEASSKIEYTRISKYINKEYDKYYDSGKPSMNVFEFIKEIHAKLFVSVRPILLETELEIVPVTFKYDKYSGYLLDYKLSEDDNPQCPLISSRYTYKKHKIMKKDIVKFVSLSHQYRLASKLNSTYSNEIIKCCQDLCKDNNNL